MTPASESMTLPLFVALLAATTILGAGLRLYNLGAPSVWADEMFTLRDALGPAPPGYRSTRIGLELSGVDVEAIEPEAYSSFRAHGMNEWNMRIGSCVLGCLAIPLLGFVGASFLGRRAALFLALLLAVNTWHLLWSQHARFYAPMFLYSGLALALYYSATIDARKARSHVKLALSMVFALTAVATKPTSSLLLGIIGVDVLFQWFKSRKFPVPPASLAILVVGGLACFAVAASSFTGDSAASTAHFLGRSQGASPLRVVSGNLWLTGFPVVIMAVASTLALWRTQPRLVTFLVAATVVPVVAFAVLATFAHVSLRYTFTSVFGWLALASLGLNWLWETTQPRLGWIAACVPIALLLGIIAKENLVYYESGYGNRARWRHAFDYVERNRLPGEMVISRDKWAGQFYLEDPTILSVAIDFCVPDAGLCVGPDPRFTSWSQLQSDAWFVVKGTRFEINEGKPHWLDGRAVMRNVYPNRIPFPQETVRVYYYQAARNRQQEGRS